MIEATLELWDACASKLINVAPTTCVKDIAGHEPRTLEEFIAEHKDVFLGHTRWDEGDEVMR
jgi:hypothetical protein